MAYSQKQILQNKILTQTTISFNLSLKTWYLLYHVYEKKSYVANLNLEFVDKSYLDLVLNYLFQNLEEKIKQSLSANTLHLKITDQDFVWNNEEHSLRKLVSNSKNLKSVILEFYNCYYYDQKYFANYPSSICHYSTVISEFKEIENITIHFQSDKIDDKTVTLLFNNMNQLEKLTHLNINLRENCFGEQGITMLSQQISQIKNLCCLNLNLYKIKIKNEGAINLAQNLALCLNLREIGIDNSYNQITQEAIYKYIHLLSQNSSLKCLNLNLYDNKIGSQEIDIFPLQLANLVSLSLSLRYTELGNRGLKCLSQIFNLNQTIENLFLEFYNCYFNDEAINCFSQSIQTCQNLSKLQLFFSSLATSDYTLSYLVQSISQCLNLKQLILSFESCQIQDQLLLIIGEKLQLMKNLINLDLNLNKNQFRDQALQKFGQQISQLKQIKILQISVRFTQCYQALNFVLELQTISSLNHLTLSLPRVNDMTERKKIFNLFKRKNKKLVFFKIKMY
ncbi:hypothetical protein TTHERM_00101250 (macronuclear) [Tetrahymena thermophila SB210]|uniref:Kinase domain protein n=1 Tax=Tetrahymena thermophila (strain SB210) TaxID=312017 RepID=Q234S4_TETTS|nr:hypothetical protein TTHERM_00101250 [Tetrahymena thermophila SB210]EAR91929.2 hypothetical protein TTHERM_00101250 [Tetrahymena thermophila SB210]|eukprot:XP_001012174.2 hypothetical protein TTHERM_00101250 [Tetrahymena thermophila SB210]